MKTPYILKSINPALMHFVRNSLPVALLTICLFFTHCQSQAPRTFDVLIFNGKIYDGRGDSPYAGAVGINADTIAHVGACDPCKGTVEVDAKGMAISPGFINMLSWASHTLIVDGRSQSDIRQGVTLEVFGEGWSEGPINEAMRRELVNGQGEVKYDIPWTTLGEYLEYMEEKGVSPNIASFVGATTLRLHEIGYEDRTPTAEEMENMKALARQAMEEGALGIGSSLIYAPAFYAETEELIELCKVAASYEGMYISHLRNESNQLLEALDELIRIADEAGLAAEVYHLKAAGNTNFHKLDQVIAKIDSARAAGLEISTDMYNYTAGATGLDAAMPPWVQEGGYAAWARRLQDPTTRRRVAAEMRQNPTDWENLYYHAGPDKVLLSGFRSQHLRKYTGMTLAAVAADMGKSPEETAMDLVVLDSSRVDAVYFLMDEDNVRRQIQLPYMSFCSDAGSIAPEGSFLNSNPHPRAYGNFARLLGKYVREEKVISLEEAVYKLTHLSATKLKIRKRGLLAPGYYADVVVFDPDSISDHATFEAPHQYATGMAYVWVNGTLVLKEGEHTGATPGRVVRGPGYQNN